MAGSAKPSTPSKALVFARRTGSTVFLWVLVTAVFFSRSSWAFLGLVGALAMIATVEYFRMLGAAKVSCFPRFGIAAAAAYCAALYAPLSRGIQPPPWLDAFAIAMVAAGAFALQLRHPVRGIESLTSIAFNLLGFVYIAFLFNFTARLLFAPPGAAAGAGTVSDEGAFLLLWLLAVTKFTDMGAYITGSLVGRHKMIPHISPAKTWEGFAGALCFAQLAGCGLFALFPGHLSTLGGWNQVICLGFVLAVLAVVGDLAESVIKRALAAKDSGSVLPGIGGSLDLIDSVCFTAPALYFHLHWFHRTLS